MTWTKDFPKTDNELSLEAMRADGTDFSCGLTFPVGSSPCTLIVGGGGGSVVGLSSLDGPDVDFATKDRKISIRIEVERSKPLGICT